MASANAKAAKCPLPKGTGYYDSTARPASGPAGTRVTLSGRLPVVSESGQDVGQTATEVVAYWNLDFDHWPSVFGPSHAAAVAGSPVKFLGAQDIADQCSYHVRVRIPSVPAGTYPLEVLYGDAKGGASFSPVGFRVTAH
jgi:hypothetical protein